MRILVLDDDYGSRVKLKTLLSAYGDCDVAPDGTIGLAMFRKAHEESLPYGLITLDVEIPPMKGQQVAHEIRGWEKRNSIPPSEEVPLLMVTIKQDVKDVALSYYEGCTAYCSKPITPEKLEMALKEAKIIK